MTITPADLDAQGCFFFDDDSGEPLIFIATHVKLGLEAGLLNLDLIGTFFDFDVSSTGQWADGKADNWYSSEIQNFWVKGRALNEPSRRFHYHGEGPFSLLKAPTSAFTSKTLLRHYGNQVPKHVK